MTDSEKIPTVDLGRIAPEPTQPSGMVEPTNDVVDVETTPEVGNFVEQDGPDWVVYTDQLYVEVDEEDSTNVQITMVATTPDEVGEVSMVLTPEALRELRKELNNAVTRQADDERLRRREESTRWQRMGQTIVDPGGIRSRLEGVGEMTALYIFLAFIAVTTIFILVGKLV
ncbi:hypothetical protein [Corynebacterium crudilactis]|uniref:Uncharacterized protein n=1 Tax=Corynebacterium crudilactis TaxID=1652495 RepID=A0A172QXV4_9CORY|nr:hypothetical protein [Corynebacterium crudilactis]ANE05539.1 hypothetical protein ccrud_14460 [Corynebacterium crudilactis]